MNSATFGTAYGEGVKRTVSFLLRVGVPHDHAADVAQSAWMRGWEKREQLRDESMILSWVNTIALNDYRRTVRKRYWEMSWKPAYQDIATTFIDCAPIEMTQILDACKPADRRLLAAQLKGATAEELAEEAGVTQAAMRIRLHRARRKARALCQPQSGCDVHQAAA